MMCRIWKGAGKSVAKRTRWFGCRDGEPGNVYPQTSEGVATLKSDKQYR